MSESVSKKSGLNEKILIIVECGILIALSVILSIFKFSATWIYGGGVTFCSMLPIIVITYKHGIPWGVLSGFIYGIINFILDGGLTTGVIAMHIGMYILSVFLDYAAAFGCIGLAGIFKKFIKNFNYSLLMITVFGLLLRFFCHFLSGFVVWGEYAWEGYAPVLYSFLYNISYMGPEIIITSVTVVILCRASVFKKYLNMNI